MNSTVLKNRTKAFALFCENLPNRKAFKPYANQLIRASSSVGANYRAVCRAKSKADFINKLKIVEEECDECMFFLELIVEIDNSLKEKIQPIWNEANEILSIVVSSINTTKQNQK